MQIEEPDKKLVKSNLTYAKRSRERVEKVLLLGTRGDIKRRHLTLHREGLNELMERAFGVLCTGSHLDRVADHNTTQRVLVHEQASGGQSSATGTTNEGESRPQVGTSATQGVACGRASVLPTEFEEEAPELPEE